MFNLLIFFQILTLNEKRGCLCCMQLYGQKLLLADINSIQFIIILVIIFHPTQECQRDGCLVILIGIRYDYFYCLFKIITKVMGNDESNSGGETFQPQDWQLVDSFELLKVWRSRRDPTQRIQQHTIYSSNDEEHKQERQMYLFRKNHPSLVASRYFIAESKNQLCSSSHVQKLYLEKIPIRLSDIEHVPFPDFLHIFAQSLRGFQDLARQVGFFAVQEEYIGINQKGVVKVWMNQDYARNFYNGGKVSQEFMVNSVIQIIERNIDHSRIPKEIPSVRNYLYRNTDRLRFEQAIQEFNQFIQQHFAGNVPSRLACIDQVGGIEAIANRERVNGSESSQLTVQREYQASRNNSRPQLIDSQILKNAYPITSPRVETSSNYYEVGRSASFNGSQVVPNMQHNILTPSTVRQNTPIVRKPTATFHNGFNPYAQQMVFQVPVQVKPFQKKQSGDSNKNSNVQVQPRSKSITYQVVERPESRSFGPGSNLQQQIKTLTFPTFPQQQVDQGYLLAQQKKSQQVVLPNPPMTAKASIIQLVQPETPKPDSTVIKRGFDSSNFAFLNPQPPYNTSFITSPINIPPVPTYHQEPPKSARGPGERFDNKPISTENLEFKKQDSNNNKNSYYTNFEQKSTFLQNTQPIVAPTIAKSANEFSYDIQKSPYSSLNNDQYGAYKASTFNNLPAVTSNIIKQSQYTTVDIEDGKSSDDFLKKLKEFKTSKDNSQFFQPSPNFEPTYQAQTYSYFNDKTNSALKQVNSHQNIYNQQRYSAQQFGRNAVSNIITNNSGIQLASQKITDNTPLKFQNNLDMKYSMFQDDQPPQPSQSSYMYRNYQSNFDADILADLHKLKQ